MRIAFLIPCYNTKPHHLIEAVSSCINQTYKVNEIVIINDGSTDVNTINALKLCEQMGARVEHLYKNFGTSFALNIGHDCCRNFDWVALMGSDDISFATRIEQQVGYLKQNPRVQILGTGLFTFKDSDPYRKKVLEMFHEQIVTKKPTGTQFWCTNHGTVMYNLDIFKTLKGYNVDYKRAQDVELWARAANSGIVIHNLRQVLYAYRRYN